MIVTVDHRHPTLAEVMTAGKTLIVRYGAAWPHSQAIHGAEFIVARQDDGTYVLVKAKHTWPLGTEVSNKPLVLPLTSTT